MAAAAARLPAQLLEHFLLPGFAGIILEPISKPILRLLIGYQRVKGWQEDS
jgi:hypothetical protein